MEVVSFVDKSPSQSCFCAFSRSQLYNMYKTKHLKKIKGHVALHYFLLLFYTKDDHMIGKTKEIREG